MQNIKKNILRSGHQSVEHLEEDTKISKQTDKQIGIGQLFTNAKPFVEASYQKFKAMSPEEQHAHIKAGALDKLSEIISGLNTDSPNKAEADRKLSDLCKALNKLPEGIRNEIHASESFQAAAFGVLNLSPAESDNAIKKEILPEMTEENHTSFIKHALSREISDTRTNEGNLMRSNSIASKLISAYFLKRVTSDLQKEMKPILDLCNSSNFEIDPAKIKPEDDPKASASQLDSAVDQTIGKLTEFMKRPESAKLRTLLAEIGTITESRFPGVGPKATVGGQVLLRLLNPALVTSRSLTPTGRRNAVLLTKVLQNIGNEVLPGDKEQFMADHTTAMTERHLGLNRELYASMKSS